ncbi:hypothetical protein M2323_001602 [Rhodoblastus acidophilus]|nr:hypothetical protein [Rhodoblastus acidophilus]MCW2332685.1 hypothetical protein [Rhodoblastus acidophilus]
MTSTPYERAPGLEPIQQDPELADKLHETWERPQGLIGWLSSVDHKEIGLRYLVTAFAFLAVGGIEALIMRVQLAAPGQRLLTPEQYNQLFSLHELTMMLLYASPVLSGFSNYLFPLTLGARDMAFPRMNALSYWIYLASGLFIYASLLLGAAPNKFRIFPDLRGGGRAPAGGSDLQSVSDPHRDGQSGQGRSRGDRNRSGEDADPRDRVPPRTGNPKLRPRRLFRGRGEGEGPER